MNQMIRNSVYYAHCSQAGDIRSIDKEKKEEIAVRFVFTTAQRSITKGWGGWRNLSSFFRSRRGW